MSARASVKQRGSSRDGGLEKFAKDLARARRGQGAVAIGLPKGSGSYPDGTPVIKVGVIHEFGSEDGVIPERSWLRSAMDVNRKKHRALIRKLSKSVMSGELTAKNALELLGTQAQSDIQQRIVDVNEPPNAPSTIAAKGSSNPLVDTGLLRQSVTYYVIPKRKGGV